MRISLLISCLMVVALDVTMGYRLENDESAEQPDLKLPPILKNPRNRNSRGNCESSSEQEFFREPDKCSHFYQCHQGSKLSFQCPEGLHFDEELQICDDPRTAGCNVERAPPLSENMQNLLDLVQNLRSQVRAERHRTSTLLESLIYDITNNPGEASASSTSEVLDQLTNILNRRIQRTRDILNSISKQIAEERSQ